MKENLFLPISIMVYVILAWMIDNVLLNYMMSFGIFFILILYWETKCEKDLFSTCKTIKWVNLLLWCLLFFSFFFWDIYDGTGIVKGNYYVSTIKLNGFVITIILFFVCVYWYEGIHSIGYVYFALSEVLIFATCFMYYTTNVTIYDLHWDDVFYPVYRIASGQTQFVDFKNIYGSYCYFLAPFIKHTGIAGLQEYSFVICSLIFISLNLINFIIYKLCDKKTISFLALGTICYYWGIFIIRQQGDGFALQYIPLRVLFPLTFIALFVVYRSKKKVKMLIYGFLILALMWNLETGIVCGVAAIIAFLLENIKEKRIKRIFADVGMFVLCFAGYYGLVNIITWFRAKRWVKLSDCMFGGTAIVGNMFSLERPFAERQVVLYFVVITFIIPILVRGIHLYRKNERMYIAYVFISVLTYGLFSYSFFKVKHPYDNTGLIYLIIIMGTLLINDIGDESFGLNKIKILLGIILLGMGTASFICQFKTVKEDVYAGAEIYLPETVGFISRYCDVDDSEIIMLNSSYVYCLNKSWDTSKIPSCVDWATEEQIQDVVNLIKESEKNIVIDKHSRLWIEKFDNGYYMDEFLKCMKTNYLEPVISENENLYIYIRK